MCRRQIVHNFARNSMNGIPQDVLQQFAQPVLADPNNVIIRRSELPGSGGKLKKKNVYDDLLIKGKVFL